MLKFKTVVLLAGIASCFLAPCRAGTIFNFSYSFPGFGDNPTDVSATGTLFTEDATGGGYLIMDITGTRYENGVPESIVGLVIPNGFAGNSNLLLHPAFPLLDSAGFSFSIGDTGGDDGFGNVNVYFSPDGNAYTEDSSNVGYGAFSVTPADPSVDDVPEPGSVFLAAAGLAACWFAASRHRKTTRKP